MLIAMSKAWGIMGTYWNASKIDGDEEKVDFRSNTLDSNGPNLRDDNRSHGSSRSGKVESSGSYFCGKDLPFTSLCQ